MQENNNKAKNNKAKYVAWALGFAVLGAILAMRLASLPAPAAAGPFAYVTNAGSSGTVSVIDTDANVVVATVAVGTGPEGVAVAPDGSHAYVTNFNSNTVSVIDTALNTVVATVPVGSGPEGVAVAPDGKHAYVANILDNTIAVIDTVANTVAAKVAVGKNPFAVAITPDGKNAYVVNQASNSVSVIDTALNTVVATVKVGRHPVEAAAAADGKHVYVSNMDSNTVAVIDTDRNKVVATVGAGLAPFGVAVTPDGTHVYVTHAAYFASGSVSVIDTVTNTVVATVVVKADDHFGLAVAPDGKHAYVSNLASNAVSVIDTAANSVVRTVPVGNSPMGVAMAPPQLAVPFSAFSAKLEIESGRAPDEARFELKSSFSLGNASNGINPTAEAVTLQIGTFTTVIPPGSFKDERSEAEGLGPFTFHGVIDGVALEVLIKSAGAKRYALEAAARHVNLIGTVDPVLVTLAIGDNSGTASVTPEPL